MMRFFSQHELRRCGKRIEAGLGERRQLELAVAVGEVREHVERQPVRRFLVEGTENARVVFSPQRRRAVLRLPRDRRGRSSDAAGTPSPTGGALPPHSPETGCAGRTSTVRSTQMPLLLDRSRLRIALRDDNAAQVRAMLARHILPRSLALVLTEMNLAVPRRA